MDEKQIIRNIIKDILPQDYLRVSFDIFNGKMGACLSLFVASRFLKDKSILEKAELLMDEICQDCERMSIQNQIDFETGLAGIAFGFTYLAKHKYIDIEPNNVLKELDDCIFRWVSSKTMEELQNYTSLLYGILFYLLYSIHFYISVEDESVLLKKELVVLIINAIESSNDQNGYIQINNEPFVFNMNLYKLPIYIYIITEIYKLNFYNYKLDRIIDSLSAFILSSFPRLISNRIYLISSVRYLLNIKPIPLWEEHVEILERSIDVDAMLDYEFKDKGIALNNGVSGLLMLLSTLETEKFKFREDLCCKIVKKIERSSFFRNIKQEDYFLSTVSGPCGIVLSLSLYGMWKEQYCKL
ncbi:MULTISPECIES: lanthionine synthetase LanC family protein [unclassified Bacteroides]|uniref:lanthionine synthetase LanC family protein n=1 Tax=unclassified Bacteroides TaxID=2646097 RepID=UPI0013EBCF90|nr:MULTISPECIES: lanthionine synthetase LanC family protein [unclassified Bacteroides]QTO26235.1 hypothetical protein G7Y45_01170 [Bacteroides sp. ZJ-18]